MRNQDKDIKQKVAEYMEIMGIYAPEDQEAAAEPEDPGPDKARRQQQGRSLQQIRRRGRSAGGSNEHC